MAALIHHDMTWTPRTAACRVDQLDESHRVCPECLHAGRWQLQKRVDPEVSAALERTGAGAEVGGENPKKGEGEEGDELLPGMAFMMGCYEDELKRPIRNIVNGSLLRAILIQVTDWPFTGC